MALAIDARWMVGQHRGMGRYARAFVEPVKRNLCALLPKGVAESEYETVRRGVGFFPWWEQFELPRICQDYGVDNLICPYNTAPLRLPSRTRLTLIVHDLIYLEPWGSLPPSVDPYQTAGRIYRRSVVPKVIVQADKLVTVSNFTRDRIVEKFGISENSIIVIPNSVSNDWFVEAPLCLDGRGKFFLVVAGEAPSKNLPAFIKAYSLFCAMFTSADSPPTLKIVGVKAANHKIFQSIATRAGVGDRVTFESFLTDDALKELYRSAALFVMPSLFEGFGIPLIEAMASGTPVVCSNTTSLPEIVGTAAWLFDPRDHGDMAGVLYEAWLDEHGRADRAVLGLARAERYRNSAVQSSISEFWKKL